jgi:hypothetical protein
MSSSFKIVQNASFTGKSLQLFENIFKNISEFFDKKPYITSKKLQSIENVLKKPRNLYKSQRFLIEASISLKMS